jgi:hypothetical protein
MHCHAYYFVQPARLGCADDRIKCYVPLPALTAFDQHAGRCDRLVCRGASARVGGGGSLAGLPARTLARARAGRH